MNDTVAGGMVAATNAAPEIARRKVGILLGKISQALEGLESPTRAEETLVALAQIKPLLLTVQQEAFRLEPPRIPNEEFARVVDAAIRRLRSSHADVARLAEPLCTLLDAERSRLEIG